MSLHHSDSQSNVLFRPLLFTALSCFSMITNASFTCFHNSPVRAEIHVDHRAVCLAYAFPRPDARQNLMEICGEDWFTTSTCRSEHRIHAPADQFEANIHGRLQPRAPGRLDRVSRQQCMVNPSSPVVRNHACRPQQIHTAMQNGLCIDCFPDVGA